jgi:hypothetical protein
MAVYSLENVRTRSAQQPVLIDFDNVVARFGTLHAMGPTSLQVG